MSDKEEVCPDCEEEFCACCDICGANSNSCSCCHDCGNMYCTCCGSCGSAFCEECYNCGFKECDCECCHECECYPCMCTGINSLDWGDGSLVEDLAGETSENVWKKEWPVLAQTYNKSHPVTLAATFYLLEAMIAGVGIDSELPETVSREEFESLFSSYASSGKLNDIFSERENKPVSVINKIRLNTEVWMAKLVDDWYLPILEYMTMAIGGELRHHPTVNNCTPLETDWRRRSWAIYKRIVDHLGIDVAMEQAYDVFLDFKSEGYGGQPWADGAKVVHQAVKGQLGPSDFMNRKMFLDRVWTLEHNGGCFLNKIEWDCQKGWHQMTSVLNAHGMYPLPHFGTLVEHADPEVAKLATLYIAAVNVIRETNGQEPINIQTLPDEEFVMSSIPSIPYHPLSKSRTTEPPKPVKEFTGAMRIFMDLLQKHGEYA